MGHGSWRKLHPRVRNPCAPSPRYCVVLTTSTSHKRDDDVHVSTRLQCRRDLPWGVHGSGWLCPIRPAVARVRAFSPILPGAWQPKLMSRSGQSRKPIVSTVCSNGGPHRPPALTTLDARDGAYRHRASKQEKRHCGGSGFILGGIDGDCGLHWQT